MQESVLLPEVPARLPARRLIDIRPDETDSEGRMVKFFADTIILTVKAVLARCFGNVRGCCGLRG